MSKFARNFGISRYKADAHGSFNRIHEVAPMHTLFLRHTLHANCAVWQTWTVVVKPRSASTLELTRSVTVGDRAFAVSAARVWNGLSSDVTTSPSVIAFKRRLKTLQCKRQKTDTQLQEVCVEPPPSALNMTLAAFAAERRRRGTMHGAHPQLAIDISHSH